MFQQQSDGPTKLQKAGSKNKHKQQIYIPRAQTTGDLSGTEIGSVASAPGFSIGGYISGVSGVSGTSDAGSHNPDDEKTRPPNGVIRRDSRERDESKSESKNKSTSEPDLSGTSTFDFENASTEQVLEEHKKRVNRSFRNLGNNKRDSKDDDKYKDNKFEY